MVKNSLDKPSRLNLLKKGFQKEGLAEVEEEVVLVVVEEEEAAIAGVVGMTVVVVAAVEALEVRARWKRGLETGTVHLVEI